MLYLHIGLPKTGTTSLQGLLARSGEQLHQQGYVYPSLWQTTELGHHALAEVVTGPNASDLTSEVLAYLRSNGAPNTILSTESLSRGIMPRWLPPMTGFLERCCEVTEVKVIVVVRRLDAQTGSQFLHQLKVGRRDFSDSEQFFAGALPRVHSLFEGLGELRGPGRPWEFQMVPYFERKDSLPATLSAMDLPAEDLNQNRPEWSRTKLGLKAQAMLALPDDVLDQTGARRMRLIALFTSGEIEVPGETYDYDPLGSGLRRRIHDAALAAAQQFGVDEYISAFGSDEVPPTERVLPDPSLLSSADIESIAQQVRGANRARTGATAKPVGAG